MVKCVLLRDGLEPDGAQDFFDIEAAMETQLEWLVSKFDDGKYGNGVALMVLVVTAIDIPNMVREGVMSHSGIPLHEGALLPVCFPNQPTLTTEDLPGLIGSKSSRKEGSTSGAEQWTGVDPWAPELEILQNEEVGCFMTHCGWSSTMDAIQCKKRLVCFPVAGDQFVNCKYIVEVSKIEVRIRGERD
ncbi:UDP-glycosyltransferase 74F2-like [Punica granatum]|uniref:UDP-glycosyltransferase 74F2-like n=1 Tax=Punica granatum TaxID=22663 RepID=A0A6P8C892_PUNGR|nr:UDP-glycosyltransferase 74F2-like [Punica granatum]